MAYTETRTYARVLRTITIEVTDITYSNRTPVNYQIVVSGDVSGTCSEIVPVEPTTWGNLKTRYTN